MLGKTDLVINSHCIDENSLGELNHTLRTINRNLFGDIVISDDLNEEDSLLSDSYVNDNYDGKISKVYRGKVGLMMSRLRTIDDRCKYIRFIDAGDEMPKLWDSFEREWNSVSAENPSLIIFPQMNPIEGGDYSNYPSTLGTYTGALSQMMKYVLHTFDSRFICPSVWTKIYRKDILISVRDFMTNYFEKYKCSGDIFHCEDYLINAIYCLASIHKHFTDVRPIFAPGIIYNTPNGSLPKSKPTEEVLEKLSSDHHNVYHIIEEYFDTTGVVKKYDTYMKLVQEKLDSYASRFKL